MQKELFGESFGKIDYVECSENSEVCNKEQITKYPTWKFDSIKQEGIKSLFELSTLSGCVL